VTAIFTTPVYVLYVLYITKCGQSKILNFSKKYLLLVEIPVFCSNIEILDYHELSIIFATKTDNSITPKMAKLSIIDKDNFRYINTRCMGMTCVA
jgi:hypothetical protein